jgi:hypothetical protein
MRCRARRMLPVMLALGMVFFGSSQVRSADPDIDRLLQAPVAKDWVTNGAI